MYIFYKQEFSYLRIYLFRTSWDFPLGSNTCTSSDAYNKNLDFRHITAAVTTATMDKVRDQQLTDPDLRPIILYLETGQLPDDLSTVRQIVASSDLYLMKNNLLYHLSEHNLARH